MRTALVALLLVAGCASAPVVTRTAPEVFSPEAVRFMTDRCVKQMPLSREQCECVAGMFLGSPMRIERSEFDALMDRAWSECMGVSL